MIRITDQNESINLTKNDLIEYDKYFEGFKIKPYFDYWVVELIIVIEEGLLKEIIKIYKSGEKVLDRFISKVEQKNVIVLSESDFKRFKNIYDNLRNKHDYRKNAIVNAYSELLSYEYFQAIILEDCPNVTYEELFKELNDGYDYNEYRSEILKKSKEIFHKRYKIE